MSRLTLQQEALNCSDTSRLTEIYWSSVKKRDLSEKIAIQKAIATNTRTSIETLKECFKSSELVRLVIRNDAFREYLDQNKAEYRKYDVLQAICYYGSASMIALALKEIKHQDLNTTFIWAIINNDFFKDPYNSENCLYIRNRISDLIDEQVKADENYIVYSLLKTILKKNMLEDYSSVHSRQMIIMLAGKVRSYINNNLPA